MTKALRTPAVDVELSRRSGWYLARLDSTGEIAARLSPVYEHERIARAHLESESDPNVILVCETISRVRIA